MALGVLDPHLTGFHPQDAVGGVAELEDIPCNAFHREVFVDATDIQALRLQQHAVVGVVGDRAAAGYRREPGATAATQGVGHSVAVQVGAAHALAAVVALAEHLQKGLVVAFIQFGVRRGAVDKRQQRLFRPFLGADLGDDLLGQYIERCHRNMQGIQLATAHAVEQRGALDQVVAGGGKQAPLGRATDLVPGTADPLQEAVDGTG